jgi:hypothetical protein
MATAATLGQHRGVFRLFPLVTLGAADVAGAVAGSARLRCLPVEAEGFFGAPEHRQTHEFPVPLHFHQGTRGSQTVEPHVVDPFLGKSRRKLSAVH